MKERIILIFIILYETLYANILYIELFLYIHIIHIIFNILTYY